MGAPILMNNGQYLALQSLGYNDYDFMIVTQDHSHVLAEWRMSTEETHDYFAAQDITNKDLKGIQNCWIAPNGAIYYVPWHGHNFTSVLLGFKSATEAENAGWLHFSYGSTKNAVKQVTDKQYNACCKLASALCTEAYYIARESLY